MTGSDANTRSGSVPHLKMRLKSMQSTKIGATETQQRRSKAPTTRDQQPRTTSTTPSFDSLLINTHEYNPNNEVRYRSLLRRWRRRVRPLGQCRSFLDCPRWRPQRRDRRAGPLGILGSSRHDQCKSRRCEATHSVGICLSNICTGICAHELHTHLSVLPACLTRAICVSHHLLFSSYLASTTKPGRREGHVRGAPGHRIEARTRRHARCRRYVFTCMFVAVSIEY